MPRGHTASWPAGEMQWLHPELEHSLVWDAGVGLTGEQLSLVTGVLTRALAGPIIPAQQQQVSPESSAA